MQPLALPLWNPLGKDMVSRVPFVLVTTMITQVVEEVNRFFGLRLPGKIMLSRQIGGGRVEC